MDALFRHRRHCVLPILGGEDCITWNHSQLLRMKDPTMSSTGSKCVCEHPKECHQDTITCNQKEYKHCQWCGLPIASPETPAEGWEKEFDRTWPNQTKSREGLMALFGQEYKPHTATEAAILEQAENKRQHFKDFIGRAVATAEKKAREEGRNEAATFLEERMHIADTRGEVGPFTREEMSWWLDSAKSGKWQNGDEIWEARELGGEKE